MQCQKVMVTPSICCKPVAAFPSICPEMSEHAWQVAAAVPEGASCEVERAVLQTGHASFLKAVTVYFDNVSACPAQAAVSCSPGNISATPPVPVSLDSSLGTDIGAVHATALASKDLEAALAARKATLLAELEVTTLEQSQSKGVAPSGLGHLDRSAVLQVGGEQDADGAGDAPVHDDGKDENVGPWGLRSGEADDSPPDAMQPGAVLWDERPSLPAHRARLPASFLANACNKALAELMQHTRVQESESTDVADPVAAPERHMREADQLAELAEPLPLGTGAELDDSMKEARGSIDDSMMEARGSVDESMQSTGYHTGAASKAMDVQLQVAGHAQQGLRAELDKDIGLKPQHSPLQEAGQPPPPSCSDAAAGAGGPSPATALPRQKGVDDCPPGPRSFRDSGPPCEPTLLQEVEPLMWKAVQVSVERAVDAALSIPRLRGLLASATSPHVWDLLAGAYRSGSAGADPVEQPLHTDGLACEEGRTYQSTNAESAHGSQHDAGCRGDLSHSAAAVTESTRTGEPTTQLFPCHRPCCQADSKADSGVKSACRPGVHDVEGPTQSSIASGARSTMAPEEQGSQGSAGLGRPPQPSQLQVDIPSLLHCPTQSLLCPLSATQSKIPPQGAPPPPPLPPRAWSGATLHPATSGTRNAGSSCTQDLPGSDAYQDMVPVPACLLERYYELEWADWQQRYTRWHVSLRTQQQ